MSDDLDNEKVGECEDCGQTVQQNLREYQQYGVCRACATLHVFDDEDYRA